MLVNGGGGAGDERFLRIGCLLDGGLADRQTRQDRQIALQMAVDAGLSKIRWREVGRRKDAEGRGVGVTAGREAGSGEDAFKLAGADDGVDFGNVGADLVAVALDQAAGNNQPRRLAAIGDLVLHHLEDGVDALLLGRVDEGAGIDDQDLGVFGALGELGAVVVQEAHHHFGVDEILGAAERDEADLGARRGLGLVELRRENGGEASQPFSVPSAVRHGRWCCGDGGAGRRDESAARWTRRRWCTRSGDARSQGRGAG